MKFLLIISIVMLTALVFASCSKGGIEKENPDHVINMSDTTSPVVEISTPASSQIFASGTSINITGKITDNLGLYKGTISVTNSANNEVLKEQEYEIHGLLAYNYSLSYTTSVTKPSDLIVAVQFEDHGLNVTRAEVRVKVNP